MARILLLLFMLPAVAFGAILPTERVSVTIGASPSYQKPGEAVALRAYASVPKGVYTYSWEVNGNLAGEDVDLDRISLSSGNAGSRSVVTVALFDEAGVLRGEAEYVIRPAGIDLLWEGGTYTPSFYKGKPYANPESGIIVQALPHFFENESRIPDRELVYTWEIDGKKDSRASGYGKNVLKTLVARYKNATSIKVTAATPDGTIAAEQTVSIPHVTPYLAVYEYKPLSGLSSYRAILGTQDFNGDEKTFQAIPFFMSSIGGVSYSWFIDNEPFAVENDNRSIATLRKSGEGTGTFKISVSAAKTDSVFQTAGASFNLSFE